MVSLSWIGKVSAQLTDRMIKGSLQLWLKSSYCVGSINHPPCLWHPPYPGWIDPLGSLRPPDALAPPGEHLKPD